MTTKSKAEIEEIAGEIAPVLFAYASVSDNWTNQLKTYQNIIITEANINTMFFYTLSLLIELIIARVEDLITQEERTKLEIEIIKIVTRLMIGVSSAEDPKATHGMNRLIMDTIAGHRKAEIKHRQTIFNTYLATLFDLYKQVPKEYLTSYLEEKVKLLEEKNFRKLFSESGSVF